MGWLPDNEGEISMHLVPKTPHGEIKWEDAFEVSSLQEFVSERTKRLREVGVEHHRYSTVSERQVDLRDGNGKLIESYHLCATNPFRLL